MTTNQQRKFNELRANRYNAELAERLALELCPEKSGKEYYDCPEWGFNCNIVDCNGECKWMSTDNKCYKYRESEKKRHCDTCKNILECNK
jgi:hypothetical protein